MESRVANIGCIVLNDVVMFSKEQWIPSPPDWEPNIVSGKGYELSQGIGADMLHLCIAQNAQNGGLQPIELPTYAGPRFGTPHLVAARLGQGAFRVLLTQLYQGACAITGEHSLPVLDAAHIQPYADGGPHSLTNGLLLRSDVHRLFDRGYVTVSPDYEFRVSDRLRAEWDNVTHQRRRDDEADCRPENAGLVEVRDGGAEDSR